MQFDEAQGLAARLRDELGRAIIGQQAVVQEILTAFFAGGHVLLRGVPGLAKTLLIKTLAQAVHLKFNRVQFTPDLMPSDIIGTEVIEEDRVSGRREIRFIPGPIFANVILADEINRTPPKTQAALLEAMQEYQVTVNGVRYALDRPLFVLATQNPIEQEGTYPLAGGPARSLHVQRRDRLPIENRGARHSRADDRRQRTGDRAGGDGGGHRSDAPPGSRHPGGVERDRLRAAHRAREPSGRRRRRRRAGAGAAMGEVGRRAARRTGARARREIARAAQRPQRRRAGGHPRRRAAGAPSPHPVEFPGGGRRHRRRSDRRSPARSRVRLPEIAELQIVRTCRLQTCRVES